MRVIVTGGNSGVGKATAAALAADGHSVMIVCRTIPKAEQAAATMTGDVEGDVRAVIGDARVALAVEAVGGPGVARLLELLSDGGWLVSYSRAGDEPMWVDTLTLVGKHLKVRGFFVGDFDYRNKIVPVIREAAPLVADGTLVVPVAGVYPLEHIQDAVQHLLRGGKTLLKVA